MFNNLNILFLFMTIISTLISISSSNWLGIWMGLEFNMLSFIPLILEYKNMISNESALKYFIIQAAASTMFLFSCLIQSIEHSLFWYFNMNYFSMFIMMIALSIKLGAAPFQAWFILVIQGLSWMKSFILLTWQKLAPLFIMSFSLMNNNSLFIIAMLSAMTGALGGLSQTLTKKILAFSSIGHLGWMLSIIYFDTNFLKYYFIIYSFMLFIIILLLKSNNFFKLNQNLSTPNSFILSVSLLSLGGLPPFLGFYPKWIVIIMLMEYKFYLIGFVLVMCALVTLFYYLQMTMMLMMFKFSTQKWSLHYTNKPNLFLIGMLTVTSLSLMMSNLFFI